MLVEQRTSCVAYLKIHRKSPEDALIPKIIPRARFRISFWILVDLPLSLVQLREKVFNKITYIGRCRSRYLRFNDDAAFYANFQPHAFAATLSPPFPVFSNQRREWIRNFQTRTTFNGFVWRVVSRHAVV